MKKGIVLDKKYKELKNKVFPNLDTQEFLEVYAKFKKLNTQYKLLGISRFLEKLYIPKLQVLFLRFLSMFCDFIRWKIYDIVMFFIVGKTFDLYGVTCYCGRQGSGKTIGVVEQLERIKQIYPDCIIATNINYINQDIALTSWLQLLYLRNGEKGVVFVIDEVQNNGLDWTKFPETLLQVITMQRKQKIKIFLTAQVYKSVVIQLRRQCFDVVECKTFFKRWTRHKCYDAEEYNNIIDVATPEKRMKMLKKWKYSYIQSNSLRKLYDTNEVVDTLRDFEKLNTDEIKNLIKKLKISEKRLLTVGIIKSEKLHD